MTNYYIINIMKKKSNEIISNHINMTSKIIMTCEKNLRIFSLIQLIIFTWKKYFKPNLLLM